MAVYERPVWQLMQEFVSEHPRQFRFAELDSWFQRRYPAIQSNTLRAHLQRMTVGVSGSDSLPQLFTRVEHGLYRASKSADIVEAVLPPPVVAAASAPADVVLVTCVKTKRSTPAAAKDLYTSSLFQKQRLYAERAGVPWFILSAEHGLVGPDEWLAPYERYLPDCPPSYRRAWGQWVAARLELLHGSLQGTAIEIHASSLYASCLTPELHRLGASVSTPLTGLSQGERLAWYGTSGIRRPIDAHVHTPATTPTQLTPSSTSVSGLVAELSDVTGARRPAELRALGRGKLSSAGLYTWWVDAEGASDLSVGLGEAVLPGLIYAGQAGATRWPSGRRSKNSLWSRLIGMHLDGSSDFSTFRLTLGSVLAEPLHLKHADDPGLTGWIEDHLSAVAVAVDDADTLMAIEHQILQLLDPPLNLMGMPSTPVRHRLSELRRLGRRGKQT
jgi:hypothetical protein